MKFTYSDGTKVGEHEKHLTKVGDGAFLREPYTVTFVSKMETVEFVDYTTEQSTLVKAGTILNVCGLLKSNSAQVEIRSGNGNLYRLEAIANSALNTRLKVCNLYFTVGFYMHLKIIFYIFQKKWWADQK